MPLAGFLIALLFVSGSVAFIASPLSPIEVRLTAQVSDAVHTTSSYVNTTVTSGTSDSTTHTNETSDSGSSVPGASASTVTSAATDTSTPTSSSGSGFDSTTGQSASTIEKNDAAPRILDTTPYQPSTQPVETSKTTTPVEKPKEKIENVGTSLRQLQTEAKRAENTVRDTLTREIEAARQEAERKAVQTGISGQTVPFDEAERARRLAAIADKVSERARDTLTSGTDERAGFEPVLKSSLEEIRLLIEEETGISVDLSPSARAVTDVVEGITPELESAREEFLERGGFDLYRDRDGDGISDYDEKHIYATDPRNAYTAGSVLTDGERVLLGFDPFTSSTERVPVESPRVAGETVGNVFELHSITVALAPAVADNIEPSPEETLPDFQESVTFAGRALPNSFVTLYVFSTPIVVTVKADGSGSWTYTLDEELPDGSHELYVATVDAGGRILAKSPAVPFVKRAQAAEFTPLLVPEAGADPVDAFRTNIMWVGALIVFLFLLLALIMLGMRRSGSMEPPASA